MILKDLFKTLSDINEKMELIDDDAIRLEMQINNIINFMEDELSLLNEERMSKKSKIERQEQIIKKAVFRLKNL